MFNISRFDLFDTYLEQFRFFCSFSWEFNLHDLFIIEWLFRSQGGNAMAVMTKGSKTLDP